MDGHHITLVKINGGQKNLYMHTDCKTDVSEAIRWHSRVSNFPMLLCEVYIKCFSWFWFCCYSVWYISLVYFPKRFLNLPMLHAKIKVKNSNAWHIYLFISNAWQINFFQFECITTYMFYHFSLFLSFLFFYHQRVLQLFFFFKMIRYKGVTK